MPMPRSRDLIAKIQRVKRSTSVPVTTAEVWNIWLEHPELASVVDYLAVHILPLLGGSARLGRRRSCDQRL